jgi:hypothetical protein
LAQLLSISERGQAVNEQGALEGRPERTLTAAVAGNMLEVESEPCVHSPTRRTL